MYKKNEITSLLSTYLKKIPNNYYFILSAKIILAGISFIIMKIVQARFGQDLFDNYLLILRYSGFLVPMIVLGLGISIPRYVSFQMHKDKTFSNISYIVDTGMVVISMSIIFVLIFGLFLNTLINIDTYLFNGQEYFSLLLVYSVGLALFCFAYAVMVAFEEIRLIEIIKIVIVGFGALSFVLILKNLSQYLFVFTILNVIIFIFVIFRKKIKFTKKVNKDLIYFGLKRVAGEVMYPLLLSIPIVFSVNQIGLSYAAELSFYFMITNVFILVINPVSTILLTKAVTIFESKTKLYEFLKFGIIISAVLSIFFQITSPIIADIFGYNLDIYNSIVLSVIVFLLSLFVWIRNIINSEAVTPYLLRFTCFAVGFEILFIFFVSNKFNVDVIFSYLFAVLILCVLTVQRYIVIYKNANK
jgi:hypothetical protein